VIRVLSFAGCPNRKAAMQLAREVAQSASTPVPIDFVEITSHEQAMEMRFLGSPTIQVDGRDIEPGADAGSPVAFACRVYHTPDGQRGVPPRQWLVDALADAGHAQPGAETSQ